MTENSVTVMLLPNDDTETILEKVRTSGAQQISLIVPPGNKALQTLGGFTMLRKACDITGIDVTIYSDDEKTCDMATVCRFEVVHLDSDVAPRAVTPAEEPEPRIVVSTRPPEPDISFASVAPAAVVEKVTARPSELETRLEGLSEEDMALFDALESMSMDEDIELTPAMMAPTPTFTPPEAAPEPVREPPARERRERPARKKPSILSVIMSPLVSLLGNIYIGVVGLAIRIAARFQEKEAAEEAPSAGVAPHERTEEEVRSRKALKQRYYATSIMAVAAFAILLLAMHFFSLPKAIVSLNPAREETREMDVSINIVLEDELAEKGEVINENGTVSIHAKSVQVEMQGQSSIQTSGETMIPEGTSTGAAVFTNLTEYDIYVPAGTSLVGGGANFHTIEDITVPASYFWGSGSYVGKAQVGIIADTPGSASNVDVWTITTIEGDLAGLLRVVNEVATDGGAERQGAIVTVEDQEKLRQQLVTDLEEQAYAELQKQVGNLQVLAGTLEIETIEENFSQPVGGEATTLTLNAVVRVSALASTEGLLEQAIEQAVQQEMGEPKAGQTVEEIVHGAVQPVNSISTNVWTYRTHTQIFLVNTIDDDLKDEIRKSLRGLSYAEAQDILAGYSDRIASFSISPVFQQMPGSGRIRVVDLGQIQNR